MGVSTYTAALRLLGRRDYTVAELRARLHDREHPADEVNDVIDRLLADRTLDDGRVAAAHVRTATRIKGRGRLRIRQELVARGIAPATIAETLSVLSPEDDAAAIARMLDRKRVPARLQAAEHRRVFQQLMRKGFSADAIAGVLRDRAKG